MNIYVISLKSEQARRNRLQEALAQDDLSSHWIEAVDARGWQPAQMAPHINKASMFFNMSYDPNPGAIGCHLSHITAFEMLLASDDDAMIILEDDAEITRDFAKHLSCLQTASKSLDLIFLCDTRANRPSHLIGTSQKGLEFRFKRFSNKGTFGYVVNRKAAAYMVAHHRQFGLEIDMCLNRWWQSGLHIATTGRDLIKHNDLGSTIGYSNISPVKNPLRRLSANLYRAYLSGKKRARYQAHQQRMIHAFKKER